MLRVMTAALAIGVAMAGSAFAEMHEVQMLNRGEAGAMVFEPDLLRIEPGDTVKFIATDPAHNAESILEMIPEGAEPFKGKINEEIEITFDAEGLYGIKCLPHYAMGMVMTLAVGEVSEAPQNYLEGRFPPRARKRFEAQLSNL
ncbi:MAG: pseudoazurin [Oricola sp.]|nr:MAG: pseudoazurin [Oricola sp.]